MATTGARWVIAIALIGLALVIAGLVMEMLSRLGINGGSRALLVILVSVALVALGTSAVRAVASSSAGSVTALAPASGPSAGGNLVGVSGTAMTGTQEVDFGAAEVPAAFTVDPQGNSLSVAAPPGHGTVDVRIVTCSGTSAVVTADRYTYQPPPPTPYTGAKLTLTPAKAGPDTPNFDHQIVAATLTDRFAKPLPNMVIPFKIIGANATTGTASTNAKGVATFTYSGAHAGTDTVTATFTAGNDTAISNPSTVTWTLPTTPIQAVSTSGVNGQFYSGGCGHFCADVTKPPLWTQTFPTIDFNPPAGTVPGNTSGVGVDTRPFTDISTDAEGNYKGAIVAQGNGYQAGVGPVFAFDAVFTGSYNVTAAGDVTLNFYSDDGFILGISGGATRVAGSDVNPPTSTPLKGYPVMGADNQPTSPAANQIIVHFPAPGTYPYEVDYSECCGGQVALTMANSAGQAIAPASNLSLGPTNPPTQTVGKQLALTAQAIGKFGQPVANLNVVMTVQGANAQTVAKKTDQNGLAALSYLGTKPGDETVQVAATIDGTATTSNAVPVTWAFSGGGSAAQPPPTSGPLSPADGSVVTAPTPVAASVVAPPGQTIASWSVTATLDGPGGQSATLAGGQGAPPTPLATFDPTLLANGAYTITVSATASNGATLTSSTDVAVIGNLKLGRYVTTYQDLSVPVNGFQMEVRRSYDSTDKTVGDFGIGWHLSLSNFRVSTNRQLGAGGWSQYAPACFGALCLTAYKTSAPHFVTVTFPDGHAEMFDFTPTGGSVLFPTIGAAFTDRPGAGTTSTLSTGEGIGGLTADGDLVDNSGNPYSPTRYTLTTASGSVLVLDTVSGLVSETDSNGNSLTIDGGGLHASNGESLTWVRDGSNRITDMTGPSGEHLHYHYSADANLVDSVNPDGKATTYAYDTHHDLTGSTGPDAKPIQTLSYGMDGRLESITDADGNTVKVATTLGARQMVVSDPAGHLSTLYRFDVLGDVIDSDQVGGGLSLSTLHTYDSDGRTLSDTDPLGHTRSYTYDTNGKLASVIDANGAQSKITYNSAGEPIVVLAPSGAVSQAATYDAAGNPASITTGGQNTMKFSHNAQGQLASVVNPAGGVTSLSHDAAGHLSGVTDPAGATTGFQLDASGQVLAITDALGHTEHYSYDTSGAVTSVTTPLGGKTTYTRDARGRTIGQTDALGNTTVASYDPTGKVRSVTDQGGRRTAYTYDADGRIDSVSLPGGITDVYSYDAFGRLVSASNSNDTVTLTYDADNRLLTEASSGPAQPNVTLSYGYDAVGNRIAMTGPPGTTGYTYDPLGQLISEKDAAGGTFSFGHNPAGQLTGLARPNGVNDTLTFDAAGNPTSIESTTATGAVDQVAYAYDSGGRRTTATNSTGTTTYGYDGLGRLTSASGGSGPALAWAYDADGNVTANPRASANSLTYNAADQLIKGPTTSYAYDTSGDLVRATNTATGASTTYTWGAPGQLLHVTGPTGATTSNAYDPFDRRTTTAGPTGATASVYDGNNLVAQYLPGGQNEYFVNGPALNNPLELTQPNGVRDYFLADAQGSTTALTDANGAAIQTYTYDPYGTQSVSGSVANPLTFGGQQYDAATGLYYDHARYFDPASGRFLSQDPKGSSNPYRYANDSPVNFSDPTGADGIESAFLFQYVKNLAADLIGLVNGIINYAATCATAELTPGDNSTVACSQAFLSASILYGEIQAGVDNFIGFIPSGPLAFGAQALFDGAAAGGLEALDETVLAGPTTIGACGVKGGKYSLFANLPAALAGGPELTSNPFKLEAPSVRDLFGFGAGYAIQVIQTGQAATDALAQASC